MRCVCAFINYMDAEAHPTLSAVIETLNYDVVDEESYSVQHYCILHGQYSVARSSHSKSNETHLYMHNMDLDILSRLEERFTYFIGLNIHKNIHIPLTHFMNIVYDRNMKVHSSRHSNHTHQIHEKHACIYMSHYKGHNFIPYIQNSISLFENIYIHKNTHICTCLLNSVSDMDKVIDLSECNSKYSFICILHDDALEYEDDPSRKRINVNIFKEKNGIHSLACKEAIQNSDMLIVSYNNSLLQDIVYHGFPVMVTQNGKYFSHSMVHELYDNVDLSDVIRMSISDYANREYVSYRNWVHSASLELKKYFNKTFAFT